MRLTSFSTWAQMEEFRQDKVVLITIYTIPITMAARCLRTEIQILLASTTAKMRMKTYIFFLRVNFNHMTCELDNNFF